MPTGIYERTKEHNNNKISMSLLGKPKTKEHVERVALANRGKKRSEETRKNLSLSHMGIRQSLETIEKRVSQFRGIRRQYVPRPNRKGISPWNVGLTKETDKRVLQNAKAISIANTGKHPKSYIHKSRTQQDITRQKISKTMRDKILNGIMTPKANGSRGKFGYRVDLNNHFFWSMWEANIARILNYLKIKWEYESKNCRFETKLGTLILDFYLPGLNRYIEVKGYLTNNSKNKLETFSQLYKKESRNTFVIDGGSYKSLASLFKNKINGWEV